MRSSKFYKVICDEINLVLLIKKLSMPEEQKYYASVKRKIQNLDNPLTIVSYMTHVIKGFLHNAEEFFENLPEEEEQRLLVLKAVYGSIIDAYPPFDLGFVCADINNRTFMEDMEDFMGIIFDNSVGVEATAPKGLKSIRTLGDVRGLEKYINRNLVGQGKAVRGVIDSVKLIASGLYKSASFFFIGPTGVGKTELAKLLGRRYSGNFWKINCAEYAQPHEYAKLIGSPPGYVGHSEKSLMSEKAEKSNRWVILFDEIEKAHHKFYDFLLSLLDDGTCTDNMGKVLDFSESIFIFTSNQGISDIRVGKRLGFGNQRISVSGSADEIEKSVKKKFPVEFLNRIDNYIFFNNLEPDHLRKIAMLALKNLPVKKHKVLLDFIVENGYSEEYGARNIKRFIKNEVATVIAQTLLERKLPNKKGDLYTPKIVDNNLVLTGLSEGSDETELNQAAG
jgi:ATP-dependent Clp protease ATP-binding subunit ClpA